MNPKLEGIVERFSSAKGLNGDLSEKYEHFTNYIILLDEYFKLNDCFPYDSNIDKQLIEHINFGRNNTESIDGFFCLIQGSENIIHIDTEDQEVREWIKGKTSLKFKIVLIQTKKSGLDPKNITDLSVILLSKYEGSKNWKKFFDFRELVSSLMKEKSGFELEFSIMYALGTIKDEALLSNPTFVYKIDHLLETVKESFWIEDKSKIEIDFYDSSSILKLHEIQSKTIEAVDKIVELSLMTNLEKCGSLAEMRLGTIPVKEFKKVLYDFDSNRPYQLYEYNVRHSLDSTPVNEKISETLVQKKENIKFPLLNNGVTVIVDSMTRKGDSSLELKNIRIVNGCQTSHSILQNCINTEEYDNVIIPIKIIATQNEDILSEITFSSNNQNPIRPENLISLNKNIILLEKEYFEFNLTYEREIKGRYLFERRQGQYYSVDRKYIIDIPEQARDFIATWLRTPHMPLQYKDQTLVKFREIIDGIAEINKVSLFKICIFSGVLWCKIYEIIKSKYEVYEPGRYHILSAVVFMKLENLFNEAFNKIDKDIDKINFISLNISMFEKEIISLIASDSEIEESVKNVISIIDEMEELSKNQKGRIHYRKFYPVTIVNKIINKLKEKTESV